MTQTRVKKILHNAGLKHFLSDSVVEDIFESQFRYVTELMRNAHVDNDYPVIMVKHFCKFVPLRRFRLRKKRVKKEKNE